MPSLTDELSEQPFFSGLDEDSLTLLADCASAKEVHPGTYLFREGDPADTFFLIRRGRIALEAHAPVGGSIVIETLESGEMVGWSWLIPPYTWQFDARVVDDTSMIVFDGASLRQTCDANPALGYALLQRVAHVMLERLQATRVRLLDLYGVPGAVNH